MKKKYRNLEEIRAALEDGEIDGALVDTYVAAEHKDELFNENIFVKEILDRPFGYGVVLSGAAVNVEQRCRDYINMQITEIFHIIQNKTKTLDPAPAGDSVEQSTGLFDSQSDMFITFMIFLCGIYGVAVLAGLSYQYLIFIPGKKKVESLKASVSELVYKDALVEELREFVRSFHSELSIRITARIKKNKQTIKEIKTNVKCAKKQPKRSADYRRNVLTNPVYAGSAGENAFDLKRKSVGSESTKGILDQAQQWHSPNPAALNIAGKAGNSSSPGSNTRRRSDSQM
ncbi:hypothetical protein OS493_032109 [Desmophyllum pertusum]|uniref:Uncharacterized protein n=1 Tax=Desmophyllum pertusum TaxID=174260 RepID=A0A9W9YMR1_9CNID|nr:hypothetical protein OS493_032109 [Desmophyllum pertusum]